MSKPTLYIRGGSSKRTDSLHSGFVRHGDLTTYQGAVKLGQIVAGFGNFYVDTGDAVPSREDQLLEEPRRRTRRVLSAEAQDALQLD